MVDAPTTRRAALELDVWVRCAELVEHPVHRERLGVRPGCALGTRTLDVIAVHVPLDERDVVVTQQRVERVAHVGVRLGPAEIEHELVAEEQRLVALRRQRPLGVCPVQVAVRADHLRFDPDAELHAETADVPDQRVEALGVGDGRDGPVAEPRGVVAA